MKYIDYYTGFLTSLHSVINFKFFFFGRKIFRQISSTNRFQVMRKTPFTVADLEILKGEGNNIYFYHTEMCKSTHQELSTFK